MKQIGDIIRRAIQTGDHSMNLADWGWAAAGLLFGGFVGMLIGTMTVLLYRGLWILLLVLLPLLILQFLFEGAVAALARRWKSRRGYLAQPVSVPRHLRTDLPWLRRYGFYVGSLLGMAYGLCTAAAST